MIKEEERAVKAEALNKKWNVAIAEVFAGSEYHDDPGRVVNEIKDLQKRHWDLLKEQALTRKKKYETDLRDVEVRKAMDGDLLESHKGYELIWLATKRFQAALGIRELSEKEKRELL